MAYRTRPTAREVFKDIQGKMKTVRSMSVSNRSQMAAGPVEANVLTDLMNLYYSTVRSINTEISETPGLARVAQEEYDDPSYDVATEYAVSEAAMNEAAQWIRDNLPTTPEGNPDLLLWDGADIKFRSFSTAATAPLLPLVDAVINSIEAP